MREAICNKIEEEYGICAEYPFQEDSVTAVLRHKRSKKWFAIFMKVRGDRLGFNDGRTYDVVNVKCHPQEACFLHAAEGILPAYHMNKTHWITILLNGAIPFEMAYDLIEKSYELVANKGKV